MSDDSDDPPGAALEPPAPARAAQRRPRRRRARAYPAAPRDRAVRARRRAVRRLVRVRLFQPFTGSGTGASGHDPARAPARARSATCSAADGVVDSGFFFSVRAMLDGDRSKFLAGTFTLRHGMSYCGRAARR